METIRLIDSFRNVIATRNSIVYFFESLPHADLILDFKNIEFISRSAAHEYLRQKAFSNFSIKEINMSQNVKSMFMVVSSNIKKIIA